MIYSLYIQTPIGLCLLKEDAGALIECSLVRDIAVAGGDSTPVLNLAALELKEYFEGKRKTFSVPLNLIGTDFRCQVWNVLRKIPYGEVRSYGYVAKAIGNLKASRAVGGACHNNQILIFVPCHRVLGADGSLTGFGCGEDVKSYLLNLEKKWRF